MRELLDKVKKELDKIGDKGLTAANLETTYKLIDIYKDIKEAAYYGKMCEDDSYDARGRYSGDIWDTRKRREEHYQPWDDRLDRYFGRIRDGIDDYSAGRTRYQEGSSSDREQMLKGIDMAMSALVSFVETLYDHAESPKEKEAIKDHIDKLKRL